LRSVRDRRTRAALIGLLAAAVVAGAVVWLERLGSLEDHRELVRHVRHGDVERAAALLKSGYGTYLADILQRQRQSVLNVRS